MAEKRLTDCKEDYQINDDDVFKCVIDFYLEALQTQAKKQNVKLKTYELDYEKGIEVRGCEENVKNVLEYVKESVRSISVENKKYNHIGYFHTSDGQEKLKILEQKYWVKLKIETDEEPLESTTTSNQNPGGPSYRWKFPEGQQLLLTYGSGLETGAEVVTEAFETDRSVLKQDFKTEKRDGVLIVQFPVPSKHNQIEQLKDGVSRLLQKFSSEGYRTIAVEVDTCRSWKMKLFCKAVVTTFVQCIKSKGIVMDLKLYICVTLGDTMPEPLKTCNSVLHELNQRFDFVQINKQLREEKQVVKVEICKGDITKIEADMIVNTVSPDLNLSKGRASRAVSKAAGPGLQAELNAKYKHGLDNGEIAITKGYELPCRYVLHGFLQMYDESNCSGYKSPANFYETSVHEFLTMCLKKAAEFNCKDISIPVIGTGALMYPTNIVAKQMFDTFDLLEPHLRPQTLKIVVYHKDEDVFQVFQDEKEKFEIKQRQDFLKRLETRREKSLLKIVGSNENIQSVKKEILSLIEASNEPSNQSQQNKLEFNYMYGQKLTPDSPTDSEVTRSSVFTPKRSSRSMQNLRKSRRGESSSVSSDSPPVSPTTDDPELAESYVSSNMFFDKDKRCRKDDEHTSTSVPNQSMLTKSNVSGIESTKLDRNSDKLKSIISQSRIGSGRDITYYNGASDTESYELLKCSKTEFELLEFFQPEFIEKYKKKRCLLEYSDIDSSIVVYGEIPITQGIGGLKLDLTNAMKKIRSLQSDSVDISNFELKLVKKHVKDLIANDVNLIINEKNKQVTIYCDRYTDAIDTSHQLKLRLGIVRQTNRQEREWKSTSTYLGQTDVQSQTNSHTGNHVDQKPSSPKDHNTQTGAKPKVVQRQFSWSTNAKNLEMFVVDNKIEVRVYQGSILHAPVDCIVNAANSNLQHSGGVARVISQAAGRNLDREGWECIRKYGNVQVGDVCVTNAGQLNYDCVIHAVGPNWSDYKPFSKADVKRCERDLVSAITKSLDMAERRGLKSIAFPGISAGIYACPWELCFVQYARAIQYYSKNHSKSKMVQEIHFVDTNDDLVKNLQYTFKAMINENRVPHSYNFDSIVSRAQMGYSGQSQSQDRHPREPQGRGGQYGSTAQRTNDKRSSYPQPGRSNQTITGRPQSARQDNAICYPYVHRKCPPGLSTEEFVCVISPKQRMFVYRGAITDNLSGIDMIACGEKVEGIGAGKVAQHIEKYLGQDYVKKKKENFKNASEGKVVVVNLKAKHLQVAHVIMHQKKPGLDDKIRRLKVVGTYERLFTEAMKLKCKGVVLPLIGSGKGGVPITDATERLCEGLRQFTNSNPEYEMTIHLVNLDREKMQQSINTIEKLVNRLKSVTSPGGGRDKTVTSGTTGRNRTKLGQSPLNTREKSAQYHQHQKRNDNKRGLKPAKTHEFNITLQSKPNQEVDEDFESDEEQSDTSKDFKKYNPTNYEDENDDDSQEEQGREIGAPANNNKGESDECVICMEKLKQPKQLPCGHQFCMDCIEQQFVYKEACPVCGRVCGTITGDQPEGTMKVNKSKDMHCAGYENFGRIEITYHFPDGKQRFDHPSPGKWYKGFTRVAFLPNNKQGRKILEMLKVAFDRKLVFTIGNSRTTGQEGVITWNDIHHKTDPKPNTQFGYPDPSYLDRVTDEIAAKGVTESDI